MGTTAVLRNMYSESRSMNNLTINTETGKFGDFTDQMNGACHMHEIRNPIQTINSMVSSLNYDSGIHKKKKIRILKELTDHLVTYLNTKIDVQNQTTSARELNKIRFDLRELISSCVFMYQGQALKGVHLSYSVDANVPRLLNGDKTALTQILYNLLANSVKFTNAGYIEISIELLESFGNKSLIRISIADTGIGIRQDKLKNIFKYNVQGESNTKSQYGGAGLGLAIVKELVYKMNGIIDAKSVYGEETTFIMDIPFEINTPSVDFLSNHNVEEFKLIGENKKILIVDDNSFGWKYTEKSLRSWGFTVDLNECEETAISKLKETKYDLIFLDLFINNSNGLKIADAIRHDNFSPNKDVPIVMVTGSQKEIQKEKKQHPHITSWILKPFEISEIYSTLKPILLKTNNKKSSKITPLDSLINNDDMKVKYVKELIPIFINTTTVELAKMNREMLNGNFKAVSDIAHKIKPNYHAVELYQLSRKAEWIEENIEKDCDKIQKIEEFIGDSLLVITDLNRKSNNTDSELKQFA